MFNPYKPPRREIEIIMVEGVQFIRQKDAYEQLRRWWCDLIEFAHDGKVHWVDLQLDQHRSATPYFVNHHGWCYQLVDLRDGEDNDHTISTDETPAPPQPSRKSPLYGVKGLTDSDVEKIRLGLEQGIKGVVLAESFGISESMVSRIKHGDRWGNVTT